MPPEKISDYIRKLRRRYSDRELREALRQKGLSPAETEAVLREAGILRASAAAPVSRRRRLWLPVAATLCAALMLAAALRLSRTGSSIAEPTAADLEAYRPAPLSLPSMAPRYLPKQSDGNAAEDYLRAGRLYISLGRPRIDEDSLSGALAPVLAAVEAGTAKSRYEDLGAAVTPATAAQELTALRELAPASLFCAAIGDRVERLAAEGRLEEAEAAARRMMALGYHHAQSWALLLQAPQGNECMMAAALRLRGVLTKRGHETEAERNRLAMLAKEIVACTPDPGEIRSILDLAGRPSDLASLAAYAEEPLLRRPYLETALSAVVYGWTAREAEEGSPDPKREEFLSRVAAHPDRRVAALAQGHLSQLMEARLYLRGIPPAQRWRTLQDIQARFSGG